MCNRKPCLATLLLGLLNVCYFWCQINYSYALFKANLKKSFKKGKKTKTYGFLWASGSIQPCVQSHIMILANLSNRFNYKIANIPTIVHQLFLVWKSVTYVLLYVAIPLFVSDFGSCFVFTFQSKIKFLENDTRLTH